MTQHKRLLIEDWLPIAELSEESMRERRSMTALPPIYYLHVWWARRPLVASRAAVLASLLPADFDRAKFKYLLGIHGDPLESKAKISAARQSGERFEGDAYSYPRAFKFTPTKEDLVPFNSFKVLDPTSGGGSIPFESIRMGIETYGNDLNPIAWFIQRATIEFPQKYGIDLYNKYKIISDEFIKRRDKRIQFLFPEHEPEKSYDTNYLYSRTVICPSCGGLVPLSPNWILSSSGHGVKLVPDSSLKTVTFEIVKKAKEISAGTVKGGIGICPYPKCGATIDGDEIKAQAQAGKMGDILYAIVLKRKIIVKGKVGKNGNVGKEKIKWERDFRAPRPEDDVTTIMENAWKEKLPSWEANGILPDELFPDTGNDIRPIHYGMKYWKDLFSSRQLFGHCTSVEVFQELVQEYEKDGKLDELTKAALVYVAICIDKVIDYNSRGCTWHPKREVTAHTFSKHDFSFKWSFPEMALTVRGSGYDWIFEQVGKCVQELIELIHGKDKSTPTTYPLFQQGEAVPKQSLSRSSLQLTLGSAESLSIESNTVDAVVMDPPYYDNVMYAELSDYFYVWLKRTAGLLYPEGFQEYLTDKDREAVANPARFKGRKKAKDVAGLDYQKRMARIFTECRRVLKPEGVLTVMFTHKASGAWDALAKGLVEAGFTITASWPINTESESSMHIKDKTAAKSTIFLVCRKFDEEKRETSFWEEVEPLVGAKVRSRIAEFQNAGIKGVDLYLANFGPALEVFSEKWPLKRGISRLEPKDWDSTLYGAWDPFAVFPEDALDSARSVVKQWRLEQLLSVKRQTEFDKLTEFYILAWDAFGAPKFPADEALKLARVIGLNFDTDVKGKVCEVKGGNVELFDSKTRKAKGKMISTTSGNLIDILHSAAIAIHTKNAGEGKKVLEKANLLEDAGFQAALEAILKVLPPQVGSDFEALNNLRKLCFTQEQVPDPNKQLILLKAENTPEEEEE